MECLGNYYTEFDEVPMPRRRGIDCPDLGVQAIAVQCDLQLVSSCVASVCDFSGSSQDIYGESVEVFGEGVLVLQLRHHSWTIVQPAGFEPIKYWYRLTYLQAKRISELLASKACYLHRATAYYFYALFQEGKDVEGIYMDFEEGDPDLNKGVPFDKFPDMTYIEEINAFFGYYPSQGKQQMAMKLRNTPSDWKFKSRPLEEIDLYVPVFCWTDGKELGQMKIMNIEGLERNDVERMDYLWSPS